MKHANCLILFVATLLLLNNSCTPKLSDVISQGNFANGQIKDLTDPNDPQDAVTKAYVDGILKSFGLIPNNFAGLITDIEGNTYRTVTIGSQTWMSENLRTGKFKTGEGIPLVEDKTTWSNLTTPAYCWYENDKPKYGVSYGALYNWYTVSTGNLCPAGWHVPAMDEWRILEDYLEGFSGKAGGKLKEAGTVHWISPNNGATNESGFTALPSGTLYTPPGPINYIFSGEGKSGSWWSSTPGFDEIKQAFTIGVSYSTFSIGSGSGFKQAGNAIRCIKD